MLSKKFRATRANIAETVKTGKTIPGNILYAKVSRTPTVSAGFAIIVAKKVEKTSVGRHYIKRRTNSFLEEQLLKMNPDFKNTVVFFVKKTKEALDYTVLKEDLIEILKKSEFFA